MTPSEQAQKWAKNLTVSPVELERLTKKHIARYVQYRDAAVRGEPGYVLEELEALLEIWRSIETKKFLISALEVDELNEVEDAVLSGE